MREPKRGAQFDTLYRNYITKGDMKERMVKWTLNSCSELVILIFSRDGMGYIYIYIIKRIRIREDF